MNNDTGENGEGRESHSVTLQCCSRDQSKATTLIQKANGLSIGGQ